MVKIYVGDDKEPFCVHKQIIETSSDFFDKALNGQFAEKDGLFRLPSQESKSFGLYIQWLYSKDLHHAMKAEGIDIRTGDDTRPSYGRLLQLYSLGDVIQDSEFQNATLDAMIAIASRTGLFPIYTAFIKCVFETLPPNSTLNKYLVDMWVYFRFAEWTNRESIDLNAYPQEFWIEVTKGLINDPGQYDPNRDRHDCLLTIT